VVVILRLGANSFGMMIFGIEVWELWRQFVGIVEQGLGISFLSNQFGIPKQARLTIPKSILYCSQSQHATKVILLESQLFFFSQIILSSRKLCSTSPEVTGQNSTSWRRESIENTSRWVVERDGCRSTTH